MSDDVHVYPADEAEHHVLSGRSCQCEPRITHVVTNAIVSHRRMNAANAQAVGKDGE